MAKQTKMGRDCKRGDRIVTDGPVTIVFEHTSGTRVRIEADESVRYKVEEAVEKQPLPDASPVVDGYSRLP